MAEELRTLTGLVARRRLDAGSKSERSAVVIDCPEGCWPLRRHGRPALGDAELDAWVGQTLSLRGWLRPSYFLVDEVLKSQGG